MTSAGQVVVEVAGRDVNLQALLGRLEQQMRQTDQQGIRLANTTAGTFTAAQQKAANAAIQEAQAIARTAVAVGDNARAHQILVNALGNSAGATDKAVAGLTSQIAKLQSGSTAATQFGEGMKSGLLGMIGPAAAASAALAGLTGVVNSFGEAFRFKAELDASRQSITTLLGTTRDSGTVFAEAGTFAQKYGFTQKEITAAVSASIPIMRQSRASTEDTIGALARLAVLNPQEGIEGAAFALRELASGDITSLVERFNLSRDAARSMKDQIAGGKDAVAVLSQFLDQSGVGMETLENRTRGTIGAMNELKQAQEDLALAQAQFAQGPGLAILEQQINVTRGATRLLTGDAVAMGASWQQVGLQAQSGIAVLTGGLSGALTGVFELTGATQQQAAAQAQAAATQQQATAATIQGAAAYDTQRQAALLAAQGTQQQAVALEQDALKAQLAAVQAETLSATKLRLAQQAQIAAQALISSGAAGEATAARLAASSSLVDQLTAAYYRLAAAQGAAAAARVPGSAIGNVSDADEIRSGRRQQLAEDRRARVAAGQAAAEAEAKYQQQLGNANPLLARRRAELAQLRQGSAAYYDKLAEIDRLEKQAEKKGRGGSTKLTDQQKVNNKLLAEQERYQDQSEQAEREHGRRLLDIDRQFQEAQLKQQKKNEISKRESELDFLEAITGSELNETEKGREAVARINERFYADYEAAQKAAQAGNAEQSERLVELARKRADAELEYAERIAKAQEEKDAAEVARLEALREKRRQILDEEQKQILEGGDANVNQKNEAEQEENRRYAEQQGKLADASEAKADRIESAAIREGKAVQAVNQALTQQEAIVSRIGSRGAAPGATEGASAAPGAPTGQTAPLTGEDIAARLQSIVDAIYTTGGTVATAATAAGDKVARAVGSRAVGA